jgi:anti-sigma regulatory factor (Ser/Thr protein kinase)
MNGSAEQALPGIWHAALPYRSTDELEAAACQFAADAAGAGAALFVPCDSPSLSRIRTQLSAVGEHVTWTDTPGPGANPGQLIYAINRFAAQHPGRPAWCLQEAAWPSRPEDELWEVVRYEALLNLALGTQVRVMCPYYTGLPPEVISCAAVTHPLTATGGQWWPSPGYPGSSAQFTVPPACDLPLPPVPAGARAISFRRDLAGVRGLVSAEARAAGLSSSRASDLLLAVGELIANTLAHTTGPGTLTLWSTRDAVLCQVSDGGHITNPLAGQLRPGPAQEGGGRGLWVVHQLCDLVQIRSSPAGTTIRVHMRLLPLLPPDVAGQVQAQQHVRRRERLELGARRHVRVIRQRRQRGQGGRRVQVALQRAEDRVRVAPGHGLARGPRPLRHQLAPAAQRPGRGAGLVIAGRHRRVVAISEEH